MYTVVSISQDVASINVHQHYSALGKDRTDYI